MKRERIDFAENVPLYIMIESAVEQRLLDGTYQVGKMIPTEFELMDEFSVSRETVRKAINLLVQRGKLEKKRGIGTFVASPSETEWRLNNLSNFNAMAAHAGHHAETKVISAKIVPSDNRLKRIFGSKVSQYNYFERVRSLDGDPVEYVETFVPLKVAPTLQTVLKDNTSLYKVLRDQYNVIVSHGKKEFQASNSTSKEAKYLRITEGDAVQLVATTVSDKAGRVVEYSLARNNGIVSSIELDIQVK